PMFAFAGFARNLAAELVDGNRFFEFVFQLFDEVAAAAVQIPKQLFFPGLLRGPRDEIDHHLVLFRVGLSEAEGGVLFVDRFRNLSRARERPFDFEFRSRFPVIEVLPASVIFGWATMHSSTTTSLREWEAKNPMPFESPRTCTRAR